MRPARSGCCVVLIFAAWLQLEPWRISGGGGVVSESSGVFAL